MEAKVGDKVYYIGADNGRVMRGDRGIIGEIDTPAPGDEDNRPVFVEFGNGHDWFYQGWFSWDDLSDTAT